MPCSLSKLTLFLHLADLCLNFGIGGNEHPNGKLGQLSFSFPLEHKDRMFLEFLYSRLPYLA